MSAEDHTNWRLDAEAQTMLSNAAQALIVIDRLTCKQLALKCGYSGHFKTLDNHIHGRTPWSRRAVKAVLPILCRKFVPTMTIQNALEWLRTGKPPTSHFKGSPPFRRYPVRLRDADAVFRQLRAHELLCRESMIIRHDLPGWLMPRGAMKRYHAFIGNVASGSASATAMSHFENLRFSLCVHEESPWKRTLLVSERGFTTSVILLHMMNDLDPSYARDTLLLLADLVERKRLRFDLFADPPAGHRCARSLSEHTFVGTRFELTSIGCNSWMTVGISACCSEAALRRRREAFLSWPLAHTRHNFDQDRVSDFLMQVADAPRSVFDTEIIEQMLDRSDDIKHLVHRRRSQNVKPPRFSLLSPRVAANDHH